MDIRLGGEADWPAIAEFIEKTGYYDKPDCSLLGGHWLIATSNGKIRATLWFFAEAPHAYVDYLAGNGKCLAGLCLLSEAFLADRGIRYVRGVISQDNDNALRWASEGVGMSYDRDYTLVWKELVHGTADDDLYNGDSSRQRAGERVDEDSIPDFG